MIPLFFYGTLRNPEVFMSVTGRKLSSYLVQEASLQNHQAYFVESELYPALIQEPGSEVEGLFLYIEENILELLKRYEGEEDYELKELPCLLDDEKLVPSFIFWPKEKLKVSHKKWSYQDWLKTVDLDEYLAQIPYWMGF